MRGDVEERGEPRLTARAGDDEGKRADRAEAARRGHRPQRCAGDERDDEHDRRQHDGRAEVALHEAQPGADDGDEHHRARACAADRPSRLCAWPAGWRSTAARTASGTPTAAATAARSATQALASLTRSPMPGTNGSSIIPHDRTSAGSTSRRQKWYGTRIPIHRPDQPEHRPHQLLVEDAVRRLALVELVDRRRRQHHHQSEHHEHRDDDGDRVERDGRWRLRLRRHAPRRMPAQRRGALERLPAPVADDAWSRSS